MNIFRTDDNSTPLTEEEKQELKAKWVTTRAELNELEAQGIAEAEIWLLKNNKRDILSENFIRTLHKKMFGNVWKWAGKFRTSERNIGVAPYEISSKLKILLDDTIFWIENKTYSENKTAIREDSIMFKGRRSGAYVTPKVSAELNLGKNSHWALTANADRFQGNAGIKYTF